MMRLIFSGAFVRRLILLFVCSGFSILSYELFGPDVRPLACGMAEKFMPSTQ